MENRCNIQANKQTKQKPQNEKLCIYQYADITGNKNKLKKTKSTQKQASTNPEQQAKLMTVALLAKSPHNSEAFCYLSGSGWGLRIHFSAFQFQSDAN